MDCSFPADSNTSRLPRRVEWLFLVAPAPILGIDFLRMEGTLLRASGTLFRFYPVLHEAHKLRHIIAAWRLQFSGIGTGGYIVSAAQHRKGPGRLADVGVHLENHCTQCAQIVSEPAVFRHPSPRRNVHPPNFAHTVGIRRTKPSFFLDFFVSVSPRLLQVPNA